MVAASSATTRPSAISIRTRVSSGRQPSAAAVSRGSTPHRLTAAIASSAIATTSFVSSVRPYGELVGPITPVAPTGSVNAPMPNAKAPRVR